MSLINRVIDRIDGEIKMKKGITPVSKWCFCGTKVRHRIYDGWKKETKLECPRCGLKWKLIGER